MVTRRMNNAQRILSTLDRYLSDPLELTLYGRAAISLGYPAASCQHQASLDIDVVLSPNEIELLNNQDFFWDAQEKTNQELTNQGLYLTHIFCSDQVILMPNWHDTRVPIPFDLVHVKLFRLDTLNLILSKMMRDDPEDLFDIQFLLRQDLSIASQLPTAFRQAICPDISEIQEIFQRLQPRILDLARA